MGEPSINRIELGEDVSGGLMKMADIDVPPGVDFTSITEAGVLSTMDSPKACNVCHSPTQTDASGVLLLPPISPSAPFVLDTNDPDVTPPSSPIRLSDICAAIEDSAAFANDPNVDRTVVIRLGGRLDGKITSD